MTYAKAKKLLRKFLTSDEIYSLVGSQDELIDLATDLEYCLPHLAQLRSDKVLRVHLLLDPDLGTGWVIWMAYGKFRRAPAIFASVGPAETIALPDLINWLRVNWTDEVRTR